MRSKKTPSYSNRKDPDCLQAKPTQKHPKTDRKYLQTPTKARIKTLYREHTQKEIKQILQQEDGVNISQKTICKIVNSDSIRRVGNCPEKPETRGRKRKFSEAQLDTIEHTLDTYPDVKTMNWNQIASASDIGDLIGDRE